MTVNGEHGADADPDHRAGGRIVVRVDGALGLGQGRPGVLHREVRRQAATGLPEVHGTAGRLEPDTQFPCGADLRAEQVTGVAREDVRMVRGGGAAAGQQGGDGRAGGRVDHLLVDPGPDRVQLGEPAEQAGLLRPALGQPLVEVVMRVDQARGEQVPGPIDPLGGDAVAVPGCRPRPSRGDAVVLHHDRPGGELGGRTVHGGDVRTLDDYPALRHDADVRATVRGRQRAGKRRRRRAVPPLDAVPGGGVIWRSLSA